MREGCATVALSMMLEMRADASLEAVAALVARSVQEGLDAIAVEVPGAIAVTGVEALRDQLELLAWRTAAAGGTWIRRADSESKAHTVTSWRTT